MASNSFILPKAEVAIRDALRAVAFDWVPAGQIQAGLTGGPLDLDADDAPDSTDLPNITCIAESAGIDLPNIGTFRVSCTVQVAHAADSTNYPVCMEQSGQVCDVLFDPSFPASLAGSGFTAFGIWHTNQSKSQSGRKWLTTHAFDLVCAGSSIS